MIDQPIKYRDYDAIELLLSTEDNSTVLVESISQEKMSHYTTWMEVERKNRKYSNIGLGVISGCIPGAVLFTTLLALVNPPLYSLAGLVACTVSAVFGGTLSGSCILRTNALDKCQEAEKEIADLFKEDGSIRHYVDSQGKSLLFYLLEQQSFKLSELLVNQGLLFQYDEKTGYSIDEIEKLPFTIQLLIATPRDYQIFIFNMSREVGFDRGLTIQIIKNNSSFYRLFEEELDRILQTFNESSVEKYSAFKALKLLPEEKIDFSPKILSILETSPEDLEEILKGNRPIFQELVLDTLENERARQFIAQNREDLFERFPAISKLVEKKYPRNVEENTIFYPVKIKITENGYLRILCNMHHLDQEPEYVARKLLSKGLYKLSFNSEGKVVVSDACLIIQVTYLDQVGVDAGGLRTHFFVNLFNQLASKLLSQEKISPRLNKNDLKLIQFGELLRFLVFMNMFNEPILIGEAFHKDYLEGITAFMYREIQEDLQGMSRRRLIKMIGSLESIRDQKIYKKIINLCQWDGRNLEFAENQAHLAFIDTYYADMIEEDLPVDFIKEGVINLEVFENIKHKIMTNYIDDYFDKGILYSLHAIAKGFIQYHFNDDEEIALMGWKMLKNQKKMFSKSLMGVFNKEKLLDILHYKNKKRGWIEEWIGSKQESELRAFLTYLTGSPSIPASENIVIDISADHEKVEAHSCSHEISIPLNVKKEVLFLVLDEYCVPGGGFDIV